MITIKATLDAAMSKSNPLLLLATLAIAACGAAPADVTPYERSAGITVEEASYELVTLANQTETALGESFSVRCLMLRDGDLYVVDTGISVDTHPAVESLVVDGDQVEITPAVAGSLHVACRTADGEAVDPIGVEIEVSAYLPAQWTVEPPEQDCFGQTDRLAINYQVEDAVGNLVNGTEIDVDIQPSTGVLGTTGTGFRFTVDGTYQVTVSLLGEVDPQNTIEPVQFNIRVDATPPVFAITSPIRGQTLQVGTMADQAITVTGSVQDEASSITALVIDGVEQPVSGDGLEETFNTTHDSRWGLSVVSGHAEDACGNVAYVTVPFLRSPSYYAAATSANPAAVVPSALAAQVSQSLVDDGDRSDLDDLASVGQYILSDYAFNGMLVPGAELSSNEPRDDCTGFPGPTFASTGHLALRHPNAGRLVNIDPFVDNLSFVGGGVDFAVRVDNFDFPLQVDVEVIQCALGAPTIDEFTVDAWVGFDHLAAAGVVGANLVDGRVAASVESIDFVVDGLYIDMDCGMMDWACDTIVDLIIGAAEDMVEREVESAIAEMVPPLLTDILADVSIDTTVALPAPINTQLGVAAHLSNLAFCGPSVGLPMPSVCHADNTVPGSTLLGLSSQVYPLSRGPGIPAIARGAIRASVGPTPTFDSAATSFGVAVNEDALNQALWAVWYGGALDIPDVAAALPLVPEGVDISVYAGLPPVLMPGRNGNLFEIGLGDLQVEGSVDINALLGNPDAPPQFVSLSMTLSLVAGAAVSADHDVNAVRISLDPEPQIFVEIHQIDDYTYGQLLGERLAETLSEALTGLLGEALSVVQLPSFDLSGTAGLPSGTVWGLTDAAATQDTGWVALSGSLGTL